jgi:hypothetical protein
VSFFRDTLRLLSVFALACLLCACEIPGGASVDTDADENVYEVTLPYTEVQFTPAMAPITGAGVSGTAVPRNLVPDLYYRYNVQSKVNGNYAGMPYPPMIYTVRKVPFYKYPSEQTMIRIDLRSASGDVIRTAQATCAFDVNGKTVASVPLNAPDLLPGHDFSVEVAGPSVDQFGTGSGTLTIWLYGLGGDKNQTLHWDVPYTVDQETRQIKGEFVGTTTNEAEAKPFEGREEPARPQPPVQH